MTNKLNDQLISKLQNYIATSDDKSIYLVLAAIRGPDNHDQEGDKILTKAIRSYIGFRPGNCWGDTIKDVPDLDLPRVIRLIEQLGGDGAVGNHFHSHLSHAIGALGAEELIQFVKAEMRRRKWRAQYRKKKEAKLQAQAEASK